MAVKLLDRLVLKDLIPFFVAGVALFSGLWFAADPLLVAGRYLSQGAPLLLVLHVITVYLPSILGFTLPMAMLLAALQGFGRLSGDSEAVALYAGGIPFPRIIVPALALGVVASLLGYVINDKVSAWAESQKVTLQSQIGTYTHSPTPGLTGQPLHFETRDNNTLQATVQIEGGLDLATRTLHDVTIVLFAHDQPSLVVHAERVVYLGGTPSDLKHWRLIDVHGVDLAGQGGLPIPLDVSEASSQQLGVQNALHQTPAQIALLDREEDTLDLAQFHRRIELMARSGYARADVLAAQSDFWSRVAVPFSALVFTLIGAPLGMRSQRSSRMTGWFLAILIIFGYYVLTTTMGFAARGGVVPPLLAAFLPHLTGVLIGAALVWRASR